MSDYHIGLLVGNIIGCLIGMVVVWQLNLLLTRKKRNDNLFAEQLSLATNLCEIKWYKETLRVKNALIEEKAELANEYMDLKEKAKELWVELNGAVKMTSAICIGSGDCATCKIPRESCKVREWISVLDNTKGRLGIS